MSLAALPVAEIFLPLIVMDERLVISTSPVKILQLLLVGAVLRPLFFQNPGMPAGQSNHEYS